MDSKFIDAVQSKKLVRVRLALSNELMLDPRGVTFSEMLRYAESNLSSLYQDDDGKIYDNEKSKWSEDFLYDLKNGLDLNFSREKLALYEAVAKFVLREKAKQIIPQKVEYYSEIMGVKPIAVKINSAKKRYGSCSGKNSLNFSLYLMDKEEDFIDYVVVHELAHIKHHNHSKDFYKFIEGFMPDYKERMKLK